jgi:hypothetical protein
VPHLDQGGGGTDIGPRKSSVDVECVMAGIAEVDAELKD